MDYKKEAEKLMEKYNSIEWQQKLCLGDAGWSEFDLYIPKEQVKQCALIEIQSRIDLLNELYADDDIDGFAEETILNKRYECEQIKSELEKL